MTKSDIKKYYRLIGYLNLILSILYLFFSRDRELTERLFPAIAMNIGYHMCYYFYAGIYKRTKKMRILNNFNKNIGGMVLRVFAVFGMFASFFVIYLFVSDAISLNEYHRLLALCIPFGLLLGSYSLWTDIREE